MDMVVLGVLDREGDTVEVREGRVADTEPDRVVVGVFEGVDEKEGVLDRVFVCVFVMEEVGVLVRVIERVGVGLFDGLTQITPLMP
jgi:hypothetical protein